MGELFFLLYITKAGEKRVVWRKSGHLGAHAREMTGGGRWGQKAGVSPPKSGDLTCMPLSQTNRMADN